MFNWSYLLDFPSEINKLENLEENKEVLESFYHHLLEKTPLHKVELFLAANKNYFGLNFGSKLDQSLKSGTLNKELFDKWIDNVFDVNTDLQLGILLETFNIPRVMLETILEKQDSYERRTFTINSLRSFLFDKETFTSEPKGDSVSDDTQAVQEILNKPIKDKEMKQEQFYTKLYFYTDAKRVIFSDGKVQDIAECFSKLSPEDQASVCYEFGILASDSKHVPGIATVLGTMFMNMEMQNLKRKLSDLVSVGFIEELHHRLADCKTLEDANKLHNYAMVTFNGMKVPDLKDIIVKYMVLDNHDQFEHDGVQLAGFFAGVIFGDAMTMVQRKEEYKRFAGHYQPCDTGCPGCSQEMNPVQLRSPDTVEGKIPEWSGYRYAGPKVMVIKPTNFGVQEDPAEMFVPDIYSRKFGIGMLKGKQEVQQPKSEPITELTGVADVLNAIFGRSFFTSKETEPKQPMKHSVTPQHPRIFIIKR